MERRTIPITILLTYLIIVVVSLLWAYHCLNLAVGDWIALVSLLVFGGLFVFEGLGYILKMLREPRPKILNPRVEVDATNRFKDLIFDIKNNGKSEAKGCKVEVKAETWKEFGILKEDIMPKEERMLDEKVVNIYPDGIVPVSLCRVDKEFPKISIFGTPDHPLKHYPVLDMGKTYKIEIHLTGSNFVNMKIYKLKLNLSQWEEIGLKLDC